MEVTADADVTLAYMLFSGANNVACDGSHTLVHHNICIYAQPQIHYQVVDI